MNGAVVGELPQVRSLTPTLALQAFSYQRVHQPFLNSHIFAVAGLLDLLNPCLGGSIRPGGTEALA